MWNKYDIKTNPKWAWHELEIPKKTDKENQEIIEKAIRAGMTRELAEESVRTYKHDKMYANAYYTVFVTPQLKADGSKPNPLMVHISISNKKKGTVHDWRDLQQIKNDLVGKQYEAVELYPAEDRLVDMANQYHLWCVADEKFRFPFGFNQGRVTSNEQPTNVGKQRETPKYD